MRSGLTMRLARRASVAAAVVLAATSTLLAQQGRQGGGAPGAGQGARGGGGGQAAQPGPPATAQAAAPTDFTGTWVAVITEDWRWRMVTPPKGDAASIAATPAAIQASRNWDPARDIAAGEQCKAWGAPGVMRMPTRVRISWQDAQTLKLEFDNGTQTRLLHFDANAPAPAQADYQGFSRARWETVPEAQGQVAPGGGGGNGGGRGGGPPRLSGGLRVVTTQMKPGYMRRNGLPYSAGAVYSEAFDVTPGPPNERWLIVTSQLVDAPNLQQPYMLSSHFKREANDSKFQPRPCVITPPVLDAPRTEGF